MQCPPGHVALSSTSDSGTSLSQAIAPMREEYRIRTGMIPFPVYVAAHPDEHEGLRWCGMDLFQFSVGDNRAVPLFGTRHRADLFIARFSNLQFTVHELSRRDFVELFEGLAPEANVTFDPLGDGKDSCWRAKDIVRCVKRLLE